MDADIVQRITALEQWQESLELPEMGGQPTFLTTPYTNANFNGDSFSDVGANTKIENTDWSTTIPANAKALLIYGQCQDSGSAATAGLYFALFPAAAATAAAFAMGPSGKANDDYAWEMATVPCTDGDVWYKVNASGANTFDVWLWCFGYWI